MPKIEQLWNWRYPNRVAIIFFFLCMHQTSNTRVNIPPRRVNILGKEFEAHNEVELHPLNWIISKNNRSHNRPNRATGFRLAQKWKMVSNRYKVGPQHAIPSRFAVRQRVWLEPNEWVSGGNRSSDGKSGTCAWFTCATKSAALLRCD